MADWRSGVARALARWREGDTAGAVTMLQGCVAAAGGHREPFAALIEAAVPAVAEPLMIAVAHRHGDARMRADLEALFGANRRFSAIAALRGLDPAAARRFEGDSHAAAGQWIEVRAAYAALVTLAPDDAEARYALGIAERQLGALEAAEAHFAEALERSPGHAGAHADRGLLAWRRGDDAIAVPHLEAAHRAMPAQLRLAGLLAEAHVDAGRDDAAIAALVASLRAGAPWRPERLLPLAAELLAHPGLYAAFFRAVAAVAPEAAEACAARLESRVPTTTALASPWRELLAMPEPKRAVLCMIVRDEAARLGRLLDSIAGMVDELVIVDTGSTDDTAAIAESYGARVIPHVWSADFAEARNVALRHATLDWVLRLDADHVVDTSSRRGFRRFLQRPTHAEGHPLGYLAQLREHLGGAGPAARGRSLVLFANDPALRYEGALHEVLVDATPGRGLRTEPLNDMIIHHTGYAEGHQTRHARNVAILRRELDERPNDAALHHGLAQELRGVGDHEAAIAHLERVRALSADAPGSHAAATMLLADSHLQRRDWPAALAVLDRAIADGLANADVFGMRGHARLMAGRAAEALADLASAGAYRGAIGAGLLPRGYDGWLTLALGAFARAQTGGAGAADAMREARAAAPDEAALVRQAFALSADLTGGEALALSLLVAAGFDVRRTPGA